MLSSLFDLPEMAGVKHAPSPYGEGGDALALGSTQCLDLQVRSSRQRKRHTARRVGT